MYEDRLQFFPDNIVKSFDGWEILEDAVVSNNTIEINPSGSAGCSFSSQGIQASKCLNMSISIECSVNDDYNYKNIVECIIAGVYTDYTGAVRKIYKSIAITKEGSNISGGIVDFSQTVEMPNYDFDTLGILVRNKSDSLVVLHGLNILRSQDVSSAQSGSGFVSATLTKVIGYTNGCELYFDNDPIPTKLLYVADSEENFIGINVNNERFVSFERKNEVLLN